MHAARRTKFGPERVAGVRLFVPGFGGFFFIFSWTALPVVEKKGATKDGGFTI